MVKNKLHHVKELVTRFDSNRPLYGQDGGKIKSSYENTSSETQGQSVGFVEKAGWKFSCMDETAPCVPILTELFPKIQAVGEQFGSSFVSG